jgi:poly(A) polymerase
MDMKTAALKVVSELQKAGYDAYLVGGCVRDLLLGREPKDYDVTTNATPEQVEVLFERTIPVGAAFGVMVVMLDGNQIEVATFRADGQYSDNRRPDSVSYSETAMDDVVRRDFTINGLLLNSLEQPKRNPAAVAHFDSMAQDVLAEGGRVKLIPEPSTESRYTEGMVVDYVGGLDDLRSRVIRCIGDPVHRFNEDALRMLRAVRFAAQLGFSIEEGTKRAIIQLAGNITSVSRERIREELFKLLTGDYAVNGIALMYSTGLAKHIFSDHGSIIDLPQALERFERFPTKHPVTALAMFLSNNHGCAKGSHLHELLTSLKLSSEQFDEIAGAVQLKGIVFLYLIGQMRDTSPIAERKRLMREKGIYTALTLVAQEDLLRPCNQTQELQKFIQLLRGFSYEDIYPKPLITGDDLIAMGLQPSPRFKSILTEVETHQLNGTLVDREAALTYARSIAF